MNIAELIAALAFFGAVVICPLVYLLLKHQRAMAEVIHAYPANEALKRLEVLEREVYELKAARDVQAIRDDDRRELGRPGT